MATIRNAGDTPAPTDYRRGTRARHERLLALVRAGSTGVDELADALQVSPSTVRRDLAHLTTTGTITRTYGGASSAAPFQERELSDRVAVEHTAKSAIGARAAELVPPGATIFLDAGSTCGELARQLWHAEGLTVVTRSLDSALYLASAPGLEVVVTGGRVARTSHGLEGPLADLALGRYMVDIAFLGVDAVDPIDGVGEPTLPEAHVKDSAARRARHVVVLADASKLARGSVPAWAPLPRGWTLITNEVNDEVLDRYRAEGVAVISTGTTGDSLTTPVP
ncbi:DeoR/GlpR family DNA-binding transcription regulator [Cryobacterium sp. MLB-32]|uniref:DeoR/GlpR family DNA-binding transcription regulator n=1 Tax=Cryobacterium sp. MLB-32 TaxID=1529318 RepID=UPI00068ABE73|nr:DeoR/GlpR family DNA-binding transcription regulator [Cryobacterium sp. MLB-32]